jgi:hypothetical protein
VRKTKKVNVDILALAVKVREVSGNANLLVDVESWEHVPAV